MSTQGNIPVIDFSPFWASDPAGKAQVAADIYRACHGVGFLYLTHHGIPQAAIEGVFARSQQFFALPLAEKQAIAWASEVSNRGYIGLERERLDETQPGDLKEAFNLGREVSAEEANRLGIPPVQNLWPAGQADFRTTLTDFFNACATAAARLFRAFALALEMPEDFLLNRHTTRNYTLRLLHYPPLNSLPKPGQIRAGAHSDYGTLTLLFQDDVGGLEVLSTQGEWISAPAIPGAVLINTGDLTERWSNGVFRSTQHRVGLPQVDKAGRDGPAGPVLNHRYSIAFFCEPDSEALITCLPTCQGPNNPPKHPPITAGDYLLSRLQATY
ncbi:2-oxoglutarate and iron-dependent oxygenase domain-containing protein [Leptolyngbya sp. CCNP1308]|uniref:isopenicillin N synthase family dioxygenase n=1 Tax=Leptolyngbya sp. CCNP1308 TaxID=3110255 RepID=UPI002B214F10|nr:2-oxoglutarate and iron-dependent oxygenase domain-containing protein [Leptolyngbya sp. CCNP1308]MEA5447649.1 2-oxoglutarate and iron-dependent oxygenase domain-containing protein [Leptolyngbya sp. CCNP1308]